MKKNTLLRGEIFSTIVSTEREDPGSFRSSENRGKNKRKRTQLAKMKNDHKKGHRYNCPCVDYEREIAGRDFSFFI